MSENKCFIKTDPVPKHIKAVQVKVVEDNIKAKQPKNREPVRRQSKLP